MNRENIKVLCKNFDVTQEEPAKLLGIKQNYFSRR